RLAGPCNPPIARIWSAGTPNPKWSPFNEFFILASDAPSSTWVISKSCFTLAFSPSNSSKEASFHCEVFQTICASTLWFRQENVPIAAKQAAAFDAKLRRVNSATQYLDFLSHWLRLFF